MIKTIISLTPFLFVVFWALFKFYDFYMDIYATIHSAAVYGAQKRVKKLIDAGTSIDIQDKYGCAPLHYAIENDNLYLSLFLLENGADIWLEDNRGRTPYELFRMVSNECIEDDPESWDKIKKYIEEIPGTAKLL